MIYLQKDERVFGADNQFPPIGTRSRRTRLSPQVRRDSILECAAELILEAGLAAVTMERLARDCAISKGLVYNYFPSRDALLAALLHREQEDLRARGMAEALRTETFADLIAQTTRLYLEQTRDRGAVILPLLSDPSVARLMEAANRQERDHTIRYFVRLVRREYGLPLDTAIAAVDSLMNLTGGAGRLVSSGTMSVAAATEMCVLLITGGLERLAKGCGGASDGRDVQTADLTE